MRGCAVERTPNEQQHLEKQRQRLTELKAFLNTQPLPGDAAPTIEWLSYLLEMKSLLGHTHNATTVVATMLARDYLTSTLSMRPFDATTKPPGRPGLDIDEETTDGKRVIGEIKTTTPYQEMGANQKTSLKKDFDRLELDSAAFKFFFVTDDSTYAFVRRKYALQYPDITIVLLATENENIKAAQ